jgi:hypothetical protein
VAAEAALDQRRVLPGEDQDVHGETSGAREAKGARLRRAGGEESIAKAWASAAACPSARSRA